MAERTIHVSCPSVRGPGGIASYTRALFDALGPRPIDALGQGADARLFELPHHVRFLGSAGRQATFAARLAADWLWRPPTVFVFSHLGLMRPLALLPRRPDHRVVMVAHGFEVWSRIPAARAAGLPRVDAVVCTTRFNRALLFASNADRFSDRVQSNVIALSAPREQESLPPAPVPSAPRRTALVVSRLVKAEPLKGVTTLLRAAKLLDPSTWQVRVVGDGDARASLEAEAARLGVSDRVKFLGWVSEAAKRAEVEACDVMCLPSAQEGFGIVFLEAMVAGRPCVGAAAGAIPEVLPPECSALHPYDDEHALAAALDSVAERFRRGAITPERIRAIYDERFAFSRFAAEWGRTIDALARD